MRRLLAGAELNPSSFHRPVVTVGVFDGMHRGHRHLIEHLAAMAQRLGGESVVVTFETHPRAVIAGAAPRSILSLPHRLLLLERLGVQTAIILPFDDAMRRRGYDEFTRDILVEGIGMVGLLFGYNGKIGHGGEGSAARLEPLGDELGFVVEEAPPIALHGVPISSSRIRDAIESGDLKAADEMLGRPAAVYGRVVRGDGRGRTIGFPTANVDPDGEILPPRGVYQVVATLEGERYTAVANIGVRPTFEAPGSVSEPVLEVHIPGIEEEFYGRFLEVEIVRKLREERSFPTREALIQQIRADVDSLGSGAV
jgi:riboflavin kinase/FMN adenylyltransferase